MQLIYSNLRGPDSKSAFFQTLPQIFVIPYQGSESSTSDGVLKVFDKANKYLEKNKVWHLSLPPSAVSPCSPYPLQFAIGRDSSSAVG